jgi:FixJ family two-component response regulator
VEEYVMPERPVISIIDDDPSVRQATDGLLRSLGYRSATFASAEDFLRSDRLRDTSCLITDVQMPGLSGVELQGLLNARGSRMPIIFITAFPEERIRRCVLEAGAIGFLSKPFEEATLIEHLETALATDRNEAVSGRKSSRALGDDGDDLSPDPPGH